MAKKSKKELFDSIRKSADNALSGAPEWKAPAVPSRQQRQQQAAAPAFLPTFQQFRQQQQAQQAQAAPFKPIPFAAPTTPAYTAPVRPTFVSPAKPAQSNSEPARPLTAAPNNSAPLQTLELTGPAKERASKQTVSGPGKAQAYNANDPAQVAQQIRNQRRLGRYGDSALYRVLGGDEVADYLIQRDKATKNWQDLSLGDALSDPMYAAGTLLDFLDYGVTDVGRQIFNPSKAREISERNAAYTQAIGPKKGGGNLADSAAVAIERGAANFNASTAQTANFILGAPLRALGWEKNPLQNFSDAMTAEQQAAQAAYDRQFADASKGAQIAGDVGSSAIEALPDLILLVMSGGTSAAGQGETILTRGGARLAGREAAAASARQTGRMAAARQTAQAVARDTAKNPMFWTSFSRSAGSSYEYAKSQGADEYHASLYALLNASANATVEIGGGVQTLPWELQKGGSAAWAWFKSMIEEGDEEVVQGVIERSLQNLSYGAGNPLFPTQNTASKITQSSLGPSERSELTRLGQGGNVDLTTRPVIDAQILNDAGWDAGSGMATIYTSTFSDRRGTTAMNFTPIVLDRNGNVSKIMGPAELQQYAEAVIDGTQEDYLHLKVGATFTGKTAISEAENAAERIHEIHENAISGNTNRTAIFDPKAALSEFAMGAAVAGVLGGPSSLNQGVHNLRTGRQAAQKVNATPNVRAEQNAEVREQKAEEIVHRLSSGETVSNSTLNAVMRTPEFSALYQQQTGKALPTDATNSQLRSTIRTEIAAAANPTQETNGPTRENIPATSEHPGVEWTENGTPITLPRIVDNTNQTENADQHRGPVRITVNAETARATVEAEQAAEREYQLRRGDMPSGTLDNENERGYNENGISYGRTGTDYDANNQPVSYRWAVMSADQLIASHDVHGNQNVSYPTELQPRDRTRGTSQIQTQQIARRLNPALLAESRTAQNGAPIVRSDGVVIGGNGRVSGIQAAYANGFSTAAQYKAFILQNAERFGIDPSGLPDNPVLVRVADEGTDWLSLSKGLNVSTTAAYSATEQAVSDAEKLDADVINLLAPNEDGNLNTAENRSFIAAFMQRVVPETERGGMIDERGFLSQEGLRRVQNAIFAYAYGNSDLIGKYSESLDNNMRNVTNALLQTAPMAVQLQHAQVNGTAYNTPVVDVVLGALELFSRAKQEGVTVQEVLDQGDMFNSWNEGVARTAAFIEENSRSAKQIRSYLGALYETVLQYGDPDQISMLGEEQDHGIQSTVESAARSYEQQSGREFGEYDFGGNWEDASGLGTRGSGSDVIRRSDEQIRGDRTGQNGEEIAGRLDRPSEPVSTSRALLRGDDNTATLTERVEKTNRRNTGKRGVAPRSSDIQWQEPRPLNRADGADPAFEKARAAAQPDNVTDGMSRAERVDYFNSLLDSGMEHSEAYRRAFGSEKFGTGVFSPDNQTDAGAKASPALAKLGVKIFSPIAENLDRRSVVEGNRSARKADRQLKAKIRAINPTRAETEFAQGIANGTYSENDIPMSMDSAKIKELAGLYSAAENNTSFFVQQIRRNIKRGVREKLDGLFASADGVQVPRIFTMNMNTPQRVIRKMFKGESGEAINSYLFDPVLQNSAEQIRFMNRMLDRVRSFKLSKAESILVARVLEGRAAQKEVALLEPDMRKRVEAVAQSENPAVSRSEYGLDDNDDAFQLARRYKAWLNTQSRLEGQNAEKINKAADAYSEAYNDFYEAINDFLVNHGYEPIGFVQGYTPHMQTDEAKTGLSGILQRLGLDPEVGLLPTEIAGRTDTFKPGKQWNPYFLQRTTGDPDTDYNAVEGYESYVNYMANVLYHTDDIMKLRETGNYFRTRYAKDQVRELIEEARDIASKSTEDKVRLLIRENKLAPGSVLTDEQADAQLESYIESLYQDSKDMKKFGEFVSWLDDYTNRLAGKQTKLDRAIESFTGRRFLNLGNRLTKIFGESTIVGNLSSALNQTAQIPFLIREVGNLNVARAAKDIVLGETRRGDWDKQSDFLTGKRGVDFVSSPSGYQKVMDFAAIPFEAVDDVTSQLYVRAKYVQCIRQGMDHEAAMNAADKFATEMVGSRIKGAKPMVFESKNVFVKALTTFQLEVANSWAYISQDLPAQYQEYAKKNGTAKAAAKVSGDILKYLISAWLTNWLADELYGGSPAPFDLIGTTFDSLGAGKGLTGNEYMLRAFDNLTESLTGERKLGTDEMPEGFDGKEALDEFVYNAGRDLPYLNNALSALGISDSRMPLPSVPINTVKDAANLLSSDESKRERAKQRIGSDALKELKSWVPLGNQAYKTYTGAKALLRGGSFSGSGDKEQMQYQMPRNLMTGAKALLFGANSTKEAQDWFASGYDNLSVKETNAFKQLTGDGVDERTAYDVMRKLHGVKAEDGKQANAEKRQIITNANLSDEQKRRLFVSTFGDSREDELQALADAGLTFKQSMQAYNEWMRINDNEEMSGYEKATEFAAWADSQGFTASQATAIKDQLLFSTGFQVHAERYEKMTAEGLTPKSALSVSNALDLLEPEPGSDYVSAIQKYTAIVQLDISDDEKNAALMSLMNDTWRPRYQLTANIGITPAQYVQSYQAIIDLKNYTGKGTTQAIAKAAVDSIPGLTTEQRAVLWQVQNTSWKPSRNPYDPRVGAVVVTILSEKPDNIYLP